MSAHNIVYQALGRARLYFTNLVFSEFTLFPSPFPFALPPCLFALGHPSLLLFSICLSFITPRLCSKLWTGIPIGRNQVTCIHSCAFPAVSKSCNQVTILENTKIYIWQGDTRFQDRGKILKTVLKSPIYVTQLLTTIVRVFSFIKGHQNITNMEKKERNFCLENF